MKPHSPHLRSTRKWLAQRDEPQHAHAALRAGANGAGIANALIDRSFQAAAARRVSSNPIHSFTR